MGGGGCCAMNCCVGEAIKSFVRSIFCSDSGGGCGYHPGVNETEAHAKKIANELADMKQKIGESSSKLENKIIEEINGSLKEFIDMVSRLNLKEYGGKTLNINVEGIRENNEKLKKEVVGCISSVLNDRIVLTDSELSVILEERDDKKRADNFDKFVKKVQKSALDKLKVRIEKTVNKQTQMVNDEIKTRMNEVEKNMNDAFTAYNNILEMKTQDSMEIEKNKMNHIYKLGLYDLLSDEIDNRS